MVAYMKQIRQQVKLAMISPKSKSHSPAVAQFVNQIHAKARNDGVPAKTVARDAFKQLQEPANMSELRE